MIRAPAFALVLSCLVTSAWAQAQPAPAPTGTPAPKPVVKKPTAKAKTSPKTGAKTSAAPAESGPCRIGVISVVGDLFAVQKIGLTIFNIEYADVPIEAWGLDDLVAARVRAAVGSGAGVRRIAYPKEAFASYDHPAPTLFRNPENELTATVRQITANSGCARYVTVTKLTGKLDGSNQTLRGIGVYNRGIGSLISHTRLFANVQVRVFDGQSYEIGKTPFDLGAALTRGFSGENLLTKLDNAAFPAGNRRGQQCDLARRYAGIACRSSRQDPAASARTVTPSSWTQSSCATNRSARTYMDQTFDGTSL